MSQRALPLVLTAMAVVFAGCKRGPTSPSNPPAPSIPQTQDGLWTIYTPFKWAHDGQPHNSTYCLIYSDAAGHEMKSHLGAIADEKFRQIVPLFSFHDLSDLRYPPGGSKIEVYINRNHPESINWAYWGGFIITVRSSDLSGFWYDYAVYTVRHELTHVFEFLIEGRHTLASEYWFKEGIAVHVGCLESSLIKKIDSLNELGAWISENQNLPGQGNPIKIHRSEDFPSGANRDRYNRLFELAVRYLIDGRGLGKSYRDVLRLFYDLRDGKSFAASFQDKLGMSVVDYENSFYSRMRTYLGGGQG